MSRCENCVFFREIQVQDKITGDTYFEPKCGQGVTLTSENVIYVKNCEDFKEVTSDDQNEKPKDTTKSS